MSTYVQIDRPLAVMTPLGPDALLLRGFTGHEAISQLFHFQLDLLAENQTEVPFDRLLGREITVHIVLPDLQQRYINGICCKIGQGVRDTTFTSYQMEVVPQFWFLTRRIQSRIFQHQSVPDILKKVLTGLDVDFEIQGTFHPRDYCVQYRESDFAFVSHLMEEEGIFYFFRHTDEGHKLVVANTPQIHPNVPGDNRIEYEWVEGVALEESRITSWEKVQELRSGKITLWDHCFELPDKHLEADKIITDNVPVGEVKHKLKIGYNEKLEIYDYPGAYAQRFDDVDRVGGDHSPDLQKIFEDNRRTAEIRMQQEAVNALEIRGTSNCAHLIPGYRFTLERHFNANGDYLLTEVEHRVSLDQQYRSGKGGGLEYQNAFQCIPVALPFRPQRTTPRPTVRGTQTAVVVGPPGEEIFTDKYGRVKVQFHWDRQGKLDVDSSCWIRVATNWAGRQWGVIHIPRIGQEVVVDFLEGDPDQPIIIGSVYNADQMPPYALPVGKVSSGIKSRSTKGGGGYNELSFDDTKGKEKITIHGQYNMATTVEHDDSQMIHNNRTISVDGTHTETIKKDTAITISEGKYSHTVAAKTSDSYVKGKVTETYDDSQDTTVKNNVDLKAQTGYIFTVAAKEVKLESKEDAVRIWAAKEIKLHTGASEILMESNGTITIHGKSITLIGDNDVKISAPKVETTGTQEVKMGVGAQNITCNPAKVETSGAAITASAQGTHEITGGLVKIN